MIKSLIFQDSHDQIADISETTAFEAPRYKRENPPSRETLGVVSGNASELPILQGRFNIR